MGLAVTQLGGQRKHDPARGTAFLPTVPCRAALMLLAA